MKKNLIIINIILITIITTGCDLIKRDTLEDITIYTTSYPIEYIVNYLYGEHSTVLSIYPNGTNINKYTLTSKQIKDYSEMDMYIDFYQIALIFLTGILVGVPIGVSLLQ